MTARILAARRRIRVAALLVAAAVLVSCGGLAVNTCRHALRARADFPPTGRFAAVDGAQLHYMDDGIGVPVVLLHGNPGSIRDLDQVASALRRDHRIVAIDRPGHGYSDRTGNPTPRGQAAALGALLMQRRVERPVIVGHSWGGALALIYAVENPSAVAGLVLVGTRAVVQRRAPDLLYRLVTTPVIGRLAAWTVLLPLGRGRVEDGLAQAYAPDAVDPGEVTAAQALWLRPGAIEATVRDTTNLQEALAEYASRFGSLRIPVILIVGDRDELLPESRALHEALPMGELRVLPNAGHMIVRTRPDVIAEAVRTLSRRRSGGG